MNNVNRKNILEMYKDEISSYRLHLKILMIISILISLNLCINIISGLVNKNNILDIYNNPLLYYSVFFLSITLLKLWALYNFKRIGIYIVYIVNGLTQLIITIWFVIAFIVSFLANFIITALVLAIFAFVSIINIVLIVYYYKIRSLFIY